MANLQRQLPAGMHVAVVGMGDPQEAHAIQQQYAPNTICLLDSERAVYRAYGLGQAGVRALLAPEVVTAAIAARREGIGMGQPAGGDVMQMPGTFVINAQGVLTLTYYSRSVADHPADQLLLQAVSEAS